MIVGRRFGREVFGRGGREGGVDGGGNRGVVRMEDVEEHDTVACLDGAGGSEPPFEADCIAGEDICEASLKGIVSLVGFSTFGFDHGDASFGIRSIKSFRPFDGSRQYERGGGHLEGHHKKRNKRDVQRFYLWFVGDARS